MKKTLAILMILALLCASVAALAVEAAPWRGYELHAIWMSTDPLDIAIPNLRTDGAFALIRLSPSEGTVTHATVNEFAADDIVLRTAAGAEVPVAMMMFHKFLPSEGEGFPEIDPEQDDFDLLFFLEGGSEADLEGAALAITDDGAAREIALDPVSRTKPE